MWVQKPTYPQPWPQNLEKFKSDRDKTVLVVSGKNLQFVRLVVYLVFFRLDFNNSRPVSSSTKCPQLAFHCHLHLDIPERHYERHCILDGIFWLAVAHYQTSGLVPRSCLPGGSEKQRVVPKAEETSFHCDRYQRSCWNSDPPDPILHLRLHTNDNFVS